MPRLILTLTNLKIRELLFIQRQIAFYMPGFIASDKNQSTTTLGRGGSDFTAAILAAAVNADCIGNMDRCIGHDDRRSTIRNQCTIIPHISYQEAMELSHFGAKVIYPPTMQPVLKAMIPVYVKNTFAPADPGTLIDSELNENGNSDPWNFQHQSNCFVRP